MANGFHPVYHRKSTVYRRFFVGFSGVHLVVKVSAIVPIFNIEEYLEECLDSLIAQTISDLEIILVDDGSTDSSGDIAQRYADAHPNIRCFHIPNGGLGHARNFGATFANGKYICFVDSDDIVPDYAYEEMYLLGEKNHSDIVLGDVRRFNSKKSFSSGLHRRAFRNATEVMHITKNPDLLYDTTSWNKLFNREFYLREKLHWAEGILYEDIPVTIPAHYKARNVSYLNKVVYLWRARDGASASITQRREEISNFLDRLAVMKMVDAFFDENISDRDQHLYKDTKWLDLDFKMYINRLASADDEYRKTLVDALADYLPRVDSRAFDRIRAIDRLKYYFISKRDVQSVLDVLRFEKLGMKTLGVRLDSDGNYYGNFPFKVDNRKLFSMTEELKNSGAKSDIKSVTLDADRITVSGKMFVPRINTKDSSSVSMSASIVNTAGEAVLACEAHLKSTGKTSSVQISRAYHRVVRRVHNPNAYALEIAPSSLASLPDGRYRIAFNYSIPGLTCSTQRIGSPKKGTDARPYAIGVGDKRISVDYDLNFDLCFDISTCISLVEGVEVLSREELSVSFSDGSRESLPIDDSLESWTVFDYPYLCTMPVFSKMGDGRYLYYVATVDGRLGIQILQPGCLASSVKDGLTERIDIELPDGIAQAVSSVEFVGKRYGARTRIPFESAPGVRSDSSISARIDFTSPDQVELLRADTYELRVNYDNGSGLRGSLPVYCLMDKSDVLHNVQCDSYSYTFAFRTTYFGLWVKYLPEFLDKTKRNRRLVRKYLYPIMRLLPLKKKWVVFESSWGAKTDCNPGALYRYITSEHPEYHSIWSLNDLRIPVEGPATKVVKGSWRYFYVMSRTKYLVNNVNFIDAYEKKKGQIEIQTMHGTPLKTLGLDVPGELPTQKDVDKFLRRCNRWDYLVVQSKRAEDITRSCYAFRKRYLETGYPRNDILFEMNTPEDIAMLKKKYGIDSDKKLILYAPTWRKRNQFDLRLDLGAMADALGDEYQIGLRVHQFALAGLDEASLDSRVVNLSFINSMEELFLISDIAITDYSSLMFDYAVLNRPLLFYTYDLEEYRDRLRGFNLDFEAEAPGPLLSTTEDVIDAIAHLSDTNIRYADAYRRFRDSFCSFERGQASRRIFESVFK